MELIRAMIHRSRAFAIELSRQCAPALAGFLPAEESSDWRELGNKLEAFDQFVDAARLLPAVAPPLAEALERASVCDPYAVLWRVEGLGYALATSADQAGAPRGLLQNVPLPDRALIPLHLGLGMALAERLLGERDVAGITVRRFLDLAFDNARPGCAEVLCEPLGFVARLLHPHLLPLLDRELSGISPQLPAYLWHGAGRGLYFLPSQALPWFDPWRRALGKAAAEPPHALGRGNMLCGLAFAVALINLRQPRIVERFLESAAGAPVQGALVAGAAQAARVWERACAAELPAAAPWTELFRCEGGAA